MNAAEAYPASRIKRRRATRDEMSTRRRRIYEITEAEHPATVRGIYYQCVVQRVVGIEKDEQGYDKVQDLVAEMRRDGTIPYEWVVDESRYARAPYVVEGIPQAFNDTRLSYRKDPWQETFAFVQVWIEKTALLGVVEPVTNEYAVQLMPAIGYSSITFLHETGVRLKRLGCPLFIYQLGDLDPSGTQAAEAIERDLRRFAPNAKIHFERIAITPEQVTDLGLQAALRPTKKKDPRCRWFLDRYQGTEVLKDGELSCELDALSPSDMRDVVRSAIERQMPRHRLDLVNAASDLERRRIGRMLDHYLDELHEPAPITVRHSGGASNGRWIGEYLAEQKPPPGAWSSFGSEHVDALYPASRIKVGGGT